MKTKSLLLSILAMSMMLVGCQKDPIPEGDPDIKLNKTELTFEKDGQPQEVSLVSNREWEVVKDDKASWVTITPSNGSASSSPQKITVATDLNSGEERIAEITFTTGSATAKLKITQNGSSSKVYFNDFDKELAEKGSNWPYVYQTDCWHNESGSGAGNVSYVLEGNKASIRNNSFSTGSGKNNWFFGSDSRFCVKNITLNDGVTNYTVSFYGIRSVYGATEGGSVFDHNAFKLYVSDSGDKWVELQYAFAAGTDPDNAWDCASASFTVPAGTKTLCIGIPSPSEASTYRLDDLKLIESAQPGTTVDFTAGIEIPEFKEQPAVDPSKAEPKTVAEFISLADKNTYYKLSGTISGFNATYCSFDIEDNTGSIYVYSVVDTCKTKYKDLLKNGYKVTLAGKYEYYSTKSQHEVVNAVILSYSASENKKVVTEKISEVIAASVNDTIVLNNALVVAAAKTGYLVTDKDKNDKIFVFQKEEGKDASVKVGDVVKITCLRQEYKSMPQLAEPVTTVLSSGTEVTWPSPEDITDGFDNFTASVNKYVSFVGTLNTSGNFLNVQVPGATKVTGSLLASQDLTAYNGVPNVKFEGYYLYHTSEGKYLNLILTKVTPPSGPYMSVSSKNIKVASAAGTTTLSISSNVDWTAESDNADFSISPDSGNGDGTITITFTENTTDNERTAKLTVSTTAEVSEKSIEVVITQAKPGGDKFTKIEKKTELSAGTYYMAAYMTADNDKKDLSAYPYHCWNGTVSGTASSNSDLKTIRYSYTNETLVVNPSPSDKEVGTIADVILEEVSAKNDTYYIKCNGKYLANGTKGTNRRMILQDSAEEWVATDNANGGITLSSNGVSLGSALATYDFLRSYKNESTLKYGVVFFKKQ